MLALTRRSSCPPLIESSRNIEVSGVIKFFALVGKRSVILNHGFRSLYGLQSVDSPISRLRNTAPMLQRGMLHYRIHSGSMSMTILSHPCSGRSGVATNVS